MVSLKLGDSQIHCNGNQVYFIAEIGQNHQGSMETAKNMIMQAKRSGCNCVKFQKSCLKAKFTEAALSRKYDGINSWGKTYGEHKSYLEFSMLQYKELQDFCFRIGIDFTASAMDETSLEELNALDVPFIKIGSGDANNFLLLKKAALLKRPLVISTGMQTSKTVESIVQIMEKAKKFNYALMHCVSSYPTEPKDCQLIRIRWLKQKYPNVVIGYSGHELGVDISKAAVLLGARILERHFTLDKNQKGSDHRCSLEPNEMSTLVIGVAKLLPTIHLNDALASSKIVEILNDSNSVSDAIQQCTKERYIMPCEMPCLNKLGKSLVASKVLAAGHVVCCDDIWVKVSEPKGIPAENIYNAIGLSLISGVDPDKPFMWEHFKL